VHQNLMNQVLTNKETAAGLSRVVFDMLLALKKGSAGSGARRFRRRRGEGGTSA
jgi:hypothetical protein